MVGNRGRIPFARFTTSGFSAKSSFVWLCQFQIGFACTSGRIRSLMNKFFKLGALCMVFLASAVFCRGVDEGKAATNSCPLAGDVAVSQALKTIRQKYDVPAMAAAVVTSEGIEFVGAAGVRKRGTDVAVTLDDLWHLGSDTKAMTATLVAKLVERGQLKWETPLAEIFPQLAARMHPDFQKVTLLHLLSHRAGLPPNLNHFTYSGDDVQKLRLKAVREELAKKPKSKPGENYEYSNLGYIITGAIIERVTSNTWEHVIAEELFEPLQMNSPGFGGTGTPGKIDQPWPHLGNGIPVPQNGPAMDNPPVLGPAGRVHCTIQDWAKYIQDQLRGLRGDVALLKPESYQKLTAPPFPGDYALGWITAERPWGGRVLNHGGDNTMNCANVWVAPQKNFAILVCVNQGGDVAFGAADEAVAALIKLHNAKHAAK